MKVFRCERWVKMSDFNSSSQETHEEKHGQETVQGDTVNILRGGAGRVEAKTVNVRQGGLQSVQAEQLVIRQGGVFKAQVDNMEVLQGGVIYGRAQSAIFTASNAVAVVARGDATLDQSMARVLVSNGNITMDQSAAVAVVARNIRVENSNPLLLIAQNVEGDVKPMFGQRELVIFGAVGGLVAGVVILIAQMFKKRK